MAEYKLELRGVCKSFPGVKALDNVQLSLRPGTVHALMGENGVTAGTGKKCCRKYVSGKIPDKVWTIESHRSQENVRRDCKMVKRSKNGF